MSEAALFYGLAHDRLRRRVLWGGLALMATFVVPYEVVDDQPQMLWQLFDELSPAAIVAALAPALAGVVLLALRHRTRRASSLAAAVLAALTTTIVCRKLGSDAAAWGMLPLPPSFAERTTSVLAALACTAAGANLSYRPATRRAGRVLLLTAVAAAALFYAWPGRGEAPGVTIAHNLVALDDLPTVHFKLGALTLITVALWPAVVALLGLVHLRRPPARATSLLGMLALGGFPVILTMLVAIWYLRSSAGAALFAAVGTAAEITAVLALTAAALEVVAMRCSWRSFELAVPAGWRLRVAASVAAAMVTAFAVAQWVLARPPTKDVSWHLGVPSAAADRLFGDQVVRWSDARWRWDLRVRRDSSAVALLEVRSRGAQMVAGARPVDQALGTALTELSRAGRQLDVSSRSWYHLVGRVNRACRAAGLPYYLDPRVTITKSRHGLRRHLVIDSYRVERVRRFTADGDRHATLWVRALGTRRGGHNLGLLGLSRDMQPFALVVLDSTDAHLQQLAKDATAEPPRCGHSRDPVRDIAMLHCGLALRRMWAAPAARTAAVAKVERHELQHQIDGPLLPLCTPVLEMMAGHADRAKERVNRELSAYLAELTEPTAPAAISLVVPFRFAMLTSGGIYYRASLLLFEALGDRPLRDDLGQLDASALSAAFDALTQLPDQALSEAAAAAYERLFGDALPAMALVEQSVAPRSSSPPSGPTGSPSSGATRPHGAAQDGAR